MESKRMIRPIWAEPIKPVVLPAQLENDITEDGFRDLTWDLKLSALNGQFVEEKLQEHEFSNRCYKLYSRKKENKVIYGVEAERIVYLFGYKKLVEISMRFKYQESLVALRKVLEEKFGPAINGNYGFAEFIVRRNYILLCLVDNSVRLNLREHFPGEGLKCL